MPSPTVGKAYIEVLPDTSGFGKALNGQVAAATKGAQQGLQGTTASLGGLTSSLKTAGAAIGIFAGVSVAGQFVNASLDMAVAAEDAGTKFDAVFGPNVQQASAFVDEFANKAGFAEHEMENMLATTANVASGLGATSAQALDLSTELATMAGDVASFNGATSETPAVLAAMQSALTGEREALKTYGIVISEADVATAALGETGKQSAGDLTTLDKAMASVGLIAERAGAAMGDLDATSDSTSNQMAKLNAEWEDAQVALGEALIPALDAALPLLERMIPLVEAAATGTSVAVLAWEQSGHALRGVFDDGSKAAFAFNEAMVGYEAAVDSGTTVSDALVDALLHIADIGGPNANLAAGELMRTLGLTENTMQRAADSAMGLAEEYGLTAEETERLAELTSAAQAEMEAQESTFDSGTAEAQRFAEIGLRALAAAQEDAAGAVSATTEALMEQADVERALIDPIFALDQAHQTWLETQRDVHRDGEVTARESIRLTEAYSDMEFALAGVDESHKEAFSEQNRDALIAAGVPLEDVNEMLGITEDRLYSIDTGKFQIPLQDQQVRDALTASEGLLQVLEDIDGTYTIRLTGSVDRFDDALNPPTRQHGGGIPETGLYLLHQGETVLTEGQQRNVYALVAATAALAERSGLGGGGGGGGATVSNTFLAPVGGSMADFAAEVMRQANFETRFARA